jgi:catechol 2,3-dioxygenase-like lactoylglutathione lyase family enzyme
VRCDAAAQGIVSERTNRHSTEPLTLGGIHHVANLVPDAAAMADRYEQAFGWIRYIDEHVDEATAERIGRLTGCAPGAVTSAHVILLRHPKSMHATVEFTTLVPVRPPVPFVMAFTVPSAREAFDHLLRQGYDEVCGPEPISLGGFRPECATVRQGSVVIEVIDRLDL